MAHILSDRVRETTTTTGTGAIALGGAVANFRDFDTLMANTDTTNYAIVHRTANEWEVGRGTWNTGNTLTRSTVYAGTNGTSAVNLSAGTKDIFMTYSPLGVQPGLDFSGPLRPATNDAAALGSASLMWADLFLATGGVVNWNNGDLIITNTGNEIALSNSAGGAATLVLDDGVAASPPMRFPAGVLMTTPSDGAVEVDATNFYGTTDAGNRGYIPIRNFIRANATRTYTSNTSAQTIFNAPANGRLTVEAGTYIFEGVLSFGTMSATSGNRNINILGAGTAAVSEWRWGAWGQDAATGTAGAWGGSHMVTSTSPASVVTAAVGTSLIVILKGSVEVNTGGTIIPTTTMVTAAASNLGIGSWMSFERVGTDGVVSIGQWD